MIEKSRAMMLPGAADESETLFEEIVVHIRTSGAIPAELKAKAGTGFGAGALATMPPDAIVYMRDCDATDPVAAIAGYEKPVLIVQGGIDSSVPVHHAERLRENAARSRRRRQSFPELQHMYKSSVAGVSLMEVFGLYGPDRSGASR